MQTPTIVFNIGADVAKDEIVVACSEGSFPVRKLANKRTALLSFLKSLPPGSRIGMESTGIFHELFASLAHKFGFIVFVLNPKDVRLWPVADLIAHILAYLLNDCKWHQVALRAWYLASIKRPLELFIRISYAVHPVADW
ncbi:MAG: hypothetical protein WCE58_13690 [Gallionella sp.]